MVIYNFNQLILKYQTKFFLIKLKKRWSKSTANHGKSQRVRVDRVGAGQGHVNRIRILIQHLDPLSPAQRKMGLRSNWLKFWAFKPYGLKLKKIKNPNLFFFFFFPTCNYHQLIFFYPIKNQSLNKN